MTDIVVRPARRADMPNIARMWAALVEHHQHLDTRLPPAAENGAEQYVARLEDRLHDPLTRILVAEINGQVVGYVLAMIVDLISELFVQEACGFVADIFVEPAHRRYGVGRRLVLSLTEWFSAHDLRYYEWHVAAQNASGQAFWNALGAKPVLLRMRTEINEELR